MNINDLRFCEGGSRRLLSRDNCFLVHYAAREVFTRFSRPCLYKLNKRKCTMGINKLNSREGRISILTLFAPARALHLSGTASCATRLSN